MRRSIQITGVVLLAVGAVAFVWTCLVREGGPKYDNKLISHWMYESGVWGPLDRSGLDTNAIPFLIKGLEKRGNPVEKGYQHAFRLLPDWLRARLPRPRYASTYRANALRLLELLGREFPGAKPVMLPDVRRALAANPDPAIRFQAVDVVASLAPNELEAAAALCRALSDPVPGVRAWAAYDFRLFGQQSAIAVPALVGSLSDKDARVRAKAAESLAAFRPLPQDAWPPLRRALKDESFEVRQAASKTLEGLEPRPHNESADEGNLPTLTDVQPPAGLGGIANRR
jgi:hypothetical protein